MTFTRQTAIALFATSLGIWATCALGFWQLRRAAGKEVLQRQIEAAAQATPVTPDARDLRDPASLVHKHLRLEGRWVPSHVVYLDNRPSAGQAGFYVLMGLRIERPAVAEVVVNRGWVPRDPGDRTRIAPFETPDQPVDVSGVGLADEPRLLELAKPGTRPLGGIWQNFDFGVYGHVAGTAPLPLIVRQDPDPPGTRPDGLSRDWPDRGGELQGQIDRHHGYAFQWFALATALAGFLAYRVFRFFIGPFRHGRPVPR